MGRPKGALNEKTRVALAIGKRDNPPLNFLLRTLKKSGTDERTRVVIALGLMPYFSPKIPPVAPEDNPSADEEQIPQLSFMETARTLAFIFTSAKIEEERAHKVIDHQPAPKKKI